MPHTFDRKRGVRHGVVCAHVIRHCGCSQISRKERYESDYDFHSNDVHRIDWSSVHFANDADAQSPFDFHGTNRRQAVPPPSDGNDCSHFIDGRLVVHQRWILSHGHSGDCLPPDLSNHYSFGIPCVVSCNSTCSNCISCGLIHY